MARHVAGLATATGLIVACVVLPYLPGRFDALAMPLSFMARVFGWTGLVLVPLGALWLRYQLASAGGAHPRTTARHRLALASIAASSLIAILLAFAAWSTAGPALGILLVVLWSYCAVGLVRRVRADARSESGAFDATPLYLIILPLIAALAGFALVEPASRFSRIRAIDNSASLIRDIESYRAARGHYPPSLLSVWKDYEPGIMGVERYNYEPSGAAYNLYFEQASRQIGTREFVVYNRLGEQEMTSHDMDLLELTPADLDRQRGYHAAEDAGRAGWKLFLFD